jgi:cyanate permease
LISGVTTLVCQGLLHSITPTPKMGRNAGIMQGSSSTIAAFGPTIMGALLALGAGQYGYAFAFLIVVFIIGAVSSMMLKRQGY